MNSRKNTETPRMDRKTLILTVVVGLMDYVLSNLLRLIIS